MRVYPDGIRTNQMQHDEQEHKRKLNRAHVLKYNRKIREQ